MLSAKGYFDGQRYILEDNISIKKNQRVIITLLDDFIPSKPKMTMQTIKSYMSNSTKSTPDNISALDYIHQLRED